MEDLQDLLISKRPHHSYQLYDSKGEDGLLTPLCGIIVDYFDGDIPKVGITIIDYTRNKKLTELNPHMEDEFMPF